MHSMTDAAGTAGSGTGALHDVDDFTRTTG